jgi:ubiquinone/menaquinone biosynthesis C-methylase UbiE
MSAETVGREWWDAAYRRQGHTGWADRLVYAYDQPIRRASVRSALAQLHARTMAGVQALDVGCGTGDFAALLHSRGAHVLAFDFSPAVVDAAQRRWPASDGLSFTCASVTAVPAPSGYARLITCITVLQHLTRDEDLAAALAELRRVLDPQGRILLLELAPPLSEPKRSPDGHVVERPPTAWRNALAKAGLHIEREAVYPQWGITSLRLLAGMIDRARGTQLSAAVEQSGDTGSAIRSERPSSPTVARRVLRFALQSVRLLLLALCAPLDHLFRLPVPQRHRYYRLWILRQD